MTGRPDNRCASFLMIPLGGALVLLLAVLVLALAACEGGDKAGGEFASVSAGGDIWDGHTCGVMVDGSVACWGENYYGEATPPGGNSPPSAPGAPTRAG